MARRVTKIRRAPITRKRGFRARRPGGQCAATCPDGVPQKDRARSSNLTYSCGPGEGPFWTGVGRIAGRVVEDEVHVRLHEVGGAEEDLPLDVGLVHFEEVHGSVEVLPIDQAISPRPT